MARLRATGGKHDTAGLGSDEGGDFVAGLLHGAPGVARRLVAARGVPYDSVLPARHGVGDRVAPRGRGRVIEVVLLGHATKYDFTFVNSRAPSAESSRPKPEFFVPPKGNSFMEATMALANTVPTSKPAIA